MAIKEICINDRLTLHSSAYLIDPAATVRELIDNSVDSGSSNIVVELDSKTGGCEYISVKDNGSGVMPNDRPLMCLNHYTSKTKAFSDLQSIDTLGFRGNALSIIANLASQKGSVQITTRTNLEEIGETWFVDKLGSIKDNKIKKVNSEVGTKVVIKKLLKGLYVRNIECSKKGRSTIEKVKNLLTHYSLNFKSIKFQFFLIKLNKDQSIALRHMQRNTELNLSRVRNLMILAGLPPTAKNMILNESGIKINENFQIDLILPGYLFQHGNDTSKKNCKFLTVNNRALSLSLSFGKEITKILNYSYQALDLVKPKFWFLCFHINPSMIDINIEPEKNDIFIKNQSAIFDSFSSLVTDFLLRSKLHNLDSPPKEIYINEKHGSQEPGEVQHTVNCNKTSSAELLLSRGNERKEYKDYAFSLNRYQIPKKHIRKKKLTSEQIILSLQNTPNEKSLGTSLLKDYSMKNRNFYHSQMRKIGLYSEYTNKISINVTVSTALTNSYNYKNDLNWLMRDSSLNIALSSKMIELEQELHGNITGIINKTSHGWYYYTTKKDDN
ncbi:hypothetical protein TPHA_0G02680 [Tetrapisispora phaffii CBS 4417]|uniref:DNA mismatch repair protein S5 domain-containing protein n=1 Tax=Tetrapisispora phaffii (strain ATCC 24235 / CBS 4417 / NBRC 1672 / NRRL Y-8282 / UCD 70-5) TaxID=1071381 RepID=G8BW27_TETPH|nr:hypothetical protein TPHA_0G02680 [Tetrapisispora phaffii CBS 4417]CCE64105.1 hypothetical protein TPHA_0G02680 [Tetrapisispora phaffii CBS 4417]